MRLAGFGTLVILTDGEAIKDVFRGDPHALHSGEGNEFLSLSVGRNSVLVLDEEPHARQRRVLLPPLKGERMRAFFGAMRTATLEAVRSWPIGRPLAIVRPMQRITLRVILQACSVCVRAGAGTVLSGWSSASWRPAATRYGLAWSRWCRGDCSRIRGGCRSTAQLRDLDEALFHPYRRQRRMSSRGARRNVLADLLAATHDDGTPLSGPGASRRRADALVAGARHDRVRPRLGPGTDGPASRRGRAH